jgi:uncharacterized protein (TIGR04255 family)
LSVEGLEPASRELVADYPRRETQSMREVLFAFAPDAENVASRRVGAVGYQLRSADGRRVVQLQLDGFTFSWLRPYSTWQDLRDEAQRLWAIYARYARPEAIVRTAVRYINHIALPPPVHDLDEFFAALPDLPDAWPRTVTSFLYRTALIDLASGHQAVVTQISETGKEPGSLVFLLDIDCFSTAAFPDEAAAWETLDRLRGLKNRIFFDSVTERTLETFA